VGRRLPRGAARSVLPNGRRAYGYDLRGGGGRDAGQEHERKREEPGVELHFPAADPTEFIESWNEARWVVMQGGQGESKHWAFNDPVRREGAYKDESPSPEEYRKLGTRTVDLHPITLIQDARRSGGGCCRPPNQSASRWRLLLEAVSASSNLPLTPLVPGPLADGPLGLRRRKEPPNGPDDPDYQPQESHYGMGAAPISRGGVCCGQGGVTSSLTGGFLTGGQPTPPKEGQPGCRFCQASNGSGT